MMEFLKYFFECPFNQGENFDNLNQIIQEFKTTENDACKLLFIEELHQIIEEKSYALASKIIKKYGGRILDEVLTEQLIKYIYNKLTEQPAYLDMKNFIKDCKVVFCPICCPDPSMITSMILKATVIGKDMKIYICKPCKLVWLSEDIQANNAKDYKKFMKMLGLKGLWKELSDVDIL